MRSVPDPDQPPRKHDERERKRRTGGHYIELGPGGQTIAYSEWTCPYCRRTYENPGTVTPGVHLVGCDERPDAGQATVGDYS